MANVIQLEAFESPLRNRLLHWYILPNHPITYPEGFQEQCFTESPPFQRRLLITCHNVSEAWKLVDKWDTILVPQSPADWSIALTVVLNQPQPSLVLIVPDCKVPPVFFQKCAQAGLKAPTIVYLQTLLTTQIQSIHFDATFFPPLKDLLETQYEVLYKTMVSLLSAERMRTINIKDAIHDLRAAGATFVVSRIDDGVSNLYWYYAAETKTHTSDLVSNVLQTLLHRQGH